MLEEFAFGTDPVLDPVRVSALSTTDPRTSWLAGVTLGAAGRYAGAFAALAPLVSATVDPVYASLAASTIASHRRQLGAHAAAYRWDASALRFSTLAPAGPDHGARADALLGLAADAIGLGRVNRCLTMLDGVYPDESLSYWRSRIRGGWVTTEYLLATGALTAALDKARRTRDYAGSAPSARHVIKSDMLLATCLIVQGTERVRAEGVELAHIVVRESLDRGFTSLVWPTALLLSDMCPGSQLEWQKVASTALTSIITHADQRGRWLARQSTWMPQQLLHPGERHAKAATGNVLKD